MAAGAETSAAGKDAMLCRSHLMLCNEVDIGTSPGKMFPKELDRVQLSDGKLHCSTYT